MVLRAAHGRPKNRLARLARAGDGPWSGDLAMSEELRSAEHGTFISLLEMSCAAFARAMIDLNLSYVKMCGGGGQSATTVDLPRRCLSAPCRTETYLYLEAFACVYECMCACSRMQSSSIEHVQERHR